MTKALSWLVRQDDTHGGVVTDYLYKTERGFLRHEWVQVLRQPVVTRVAWIYWPGHAGLRRSETADHVASNRPHMIPVDGGEDAR